MPGASPRRTVGAPSVRHAARARASARTHVYRILGFSTAYRMSATRFATT